ncbi:MAG: SAM-dependent methyltransferase, partial [Actinobacteria bacterium]|nr:SAM-dependent methyltransferase [Actinomycetota bacterium]NIU65908.1 SAM-dependent methyltransferase [Actinomycetota bacterium]NIV86775.1 SAM-dependent methyltransferase [Actinomycetota bacterium]NIW27699.1 SAM-dependent methyltransferase [Actinomycetota bacterium]NIX20213.1 SAM-dependent methyltransferase [Actinomycetota bacterium]
MAEPIAYGESVLLIDSKERHYLVRMVEGGTFQYHRGVLPHAEIVGRDEGVTLLSSNGGPLT